MIRFTEDHEWLRIEGDEATVGITEHAQDTLGAVVYTELPQLGAELKQRDVAGVIESVKAAADVYMPVSGRITAINADLADTPTLLNSDPLGAGWLFKVQLQSLAELDGLLDEAAYKKRIG